MVRLLSDYRGSELEELTDEQVQRLVDLECVDAGLPFAPDPPAEYVPLKPEYDVKLYQVGKTGVMVLDRTQAEQIAEYLRPFNLWSHDIDWRMGYNPVAKRSEDELEVMVVNAHSPKQAQSRKDVMARDAELKTAHEKANTEYTNACTARQKISDQVWHVAIEARDFKYRRAGLLGQLNRCVELADGNATVGLRFFAKAHNYSEYFRVSVVNDSLKITHAHYANAGGLPELPQVMAADNIPF